MAVSPTEESYLLIAYNTGEVVLWNIQEMQVHRRYAAQPVTA